MSLVDLSKRYAKALFSVSKESNSHKETLSQLQALSSAFNTPEARAFLNDPHIKLENKTKALSETLKQIKVSSSVGDFLQVLLARHRAGALFEITKAYEALIDEDSGVTKGIVSSAKPLSSESIAALESKISTILKKKIVLKFQEDPKVIGGVVAKVGGWTFDDSLELHLTKLKEQLLNH